MRKAEHANGEASRPSATPSLALGKSEAWMRFPPPAEPAEGEGQGCRDQVLMCCRTNACTRRHASLEASAKSACLRSKKLCGAPA